MKRIPSFNDFSPGIIADIREVLKAVEAATPDRSKIHKKWAELNFKGKVDKRSTTNTQATLTSTGLLDSGTMTLTAAGEAIAAAKSKQEAAALFSAHIIKEKNGLLVLKAISALRSRQEKVTKDSLQKELKLFDVPLSTGTTDHTTLINWMAEGGLLNKADNFEPVDNKIKQLTGVSLTGAQEWDNLPIQRQIFLAALRRLAALEKDHTVVAKRIYDECLSNHPVLFDGDQLQKKIVAPLEQAGWLEIHRSKGKQGGKSGTVTATNKLMDVPLAVLLPDFESAIPSDLRSKINTPLTEIRDLLESSSKNDRGLGLELLALRMLIDLDLQPRGFRSRSADTGGAEVDLIAEGAHLLFSRWTIQCKHVTSSVHLAAVAKEVGIAMFSRSHVVVMISTNKFTQQALEFARHITETTHLQFLFIDRPVVNAYLKNGGSALHQYVIGNAAAVMQLKRGQPINPPEDD